MNQDMNDPRMEPPGSNNDNNKLASWAGQALKQWTQRRYSLPDKHVASQVLMYRQLLHTKCRPGLTLSRDYQGTTAQKAVLQMPWWSTRVATATTTTSGGESAATAARPDDDDDMLTEVPGGILMTDGARTILETGKMVISYDNLLARLWIDGACRPYHDSEEDYLAAGAPVPHQYWVDRLGFQQTDPVTDFRSGGILSLAMMVHLVEACPETHRRFVKPDGDASVLPFGLTCINITDLMAKFLMLSKNVDRMDALLSQKPFWRMFADPNALLVCHQVAMEMVANVVVEFSRQKTVTVFDFAQILGVVEQRVEHDILGAGPKSVQELRAVFERHVRLQQQQQQAAAAAGGVDGPQEATASDVPPAMPQSDFASSTATRGNTREEKAAAVASAFRGAASKFGQFSSSVAGNVMQKMKPSDGIFAKNASNVSNSTTSTASPPDLLSGSPTTSSNAPQPTVAVLPTATTTTEPKKTKATPSSVADSDEDWTADIDSATDQVTNFSIGDTEDLEEEDQDL